MGFRDQKLVCEVCGKTFFFTVTEQRRLAAQVGIDAIVVPTRCPEHRTEQGPAPVAPREPEQIRREQGPAPVALREPEQIRREHAPAPVREEIEPSEAPAEEFPLEDEGIQVKLIGAVKWFNLDKGYGFINKADGKDVFFHRSDVVDFQASEIKEGQQVEFQVRRTPKGLEAFNVSVLPVP